MKENTTLRWLLFKLAGIFLMMASLAFIYLLAYFYKFYDINSLITLGDIITYNGKVIISLSGMPIFIYMFFFALRTVLNKGITPLKKGTLIGQTWGIFSIFSFALGVVTSFLIPIVLLMLHYTSCHKDKLRVYYVTDPQLCMMIEKK
ncbi:DUF1240 domain-containing protein [Buttiauxella agrestis]|uniref:DUF1240 domain-containing protein n=1 Tax=Buttiauxella agrestis TaxID=82977 RepID=UPI00155F57FA|nr:DUF1240 domain-containing protein [Buttiauxella agrestis]BCG08217.1 DUF1240 domain-containing protein [Buttiauxella agrestis]